MNAKLSPGLLLIALLIASAIGPLTQLKQVGDHPELMTQGLFWRDTAAAGISGFADAGLALLGLLGTTLGLPALFSRWSNENENKNEGGTSPVRSDTPPAGG